MELDSNQLKKWFFFNRRELPWREDPSPYAVWVSEIMLQQTQVAVVIPYFRRWMTQFPTIEALARASREDVIKAWEGLGYYSRARNLHEGAQFLLSHYQGELPEEEEVLRKVKGIGAYTVGAIRSFAFKQRAAAVDGNVLRLFSRLFAIEDEIDKQKTRRLVEKMVEEVLPEEEPWIAMEALIELGALVCRKKAQCESCPLQTGCLAFKRDAVNQFPRQGKKMPTMSLYRLVPLIVCKGNLLIQRREEGKVMADLWEFPYLESSKPITGLNKWHEKVENLVSSSLSYKGMLPEVSHGFTRYKATLYPHLWSIDEPVEIDGYVWASEKTLLKRPFSSGHRRILTSLLNSFLAIYMKNPM
jgi:A/G-specific adenine glycosylase